MKHLNFEGKLTEFWCIIITIINNFTKVDYSTKNNIVLL